MNRVVGLIVMTLATGPGDASPVNLADLAGYHEALERPIRQAQPSRFRDLWDRPQDFVGKAVRVEGRVARQFRQPPVGQFPALVEAWLVDAAGDPTCVVFADGPATPAVGQAVTFTGTFLRKIRYEGGDTARVAPLVVGPGPPEAVGGRSADAVGFPPGLDWAVGAVGLAVVGMLLVRNHWARPVRRMEPIDPDPRFVDAVEDDPFANGAPLGDR
jgi:hypothetical protein